WSRTSTTGAEWRSRSRGESDSPRSTSCSIPISTAWPAPAEGCDPSLDQRFPVGDPQSFGDLGGHDARAHPRVRVAAGHEPARYEEVGLVVETHEHDGVGN